MALTLADAEQLIKNRLPFKLRDTLSATKGWDGRFGELPLDLREQVTDADYVVYSYRTPIAWVDGSGFVTVPDVGYSLTTSQHQYLAAHALGVDFQPKRGRTLRPAGDGYRRGGIDDA